jgi:hypothetical protein
MAEPLLNALFTIVDLVCDLTVAIDRTKRLSEAATGSDKIVDVPAVPKPQAAQRALAEAEERERTRLSSQG